MPQHPKMPEAKTTAADISRDRFCLIEDLPEELAVATVEFIEQNRTES